MGPPTNSYKRMIICCDGTWQSSERPDTSGGSMDSNVTKFSRALSKSVEINGQTVQQVVYYVSGIGTKSLSVVSHYVAGGLGLGLAENVIEAYNFLALNYVTGDEVFLFGFSRGAYTARALAGLVSTAGIIDRGSLEHSPGLYRAYQEGETALAKFGAEFRSLYTAQDAKIMVVGCWDTVGSLGIPQTWLTWFKESNTRDQFFDTNLSDKIENAFHALALDEHRKPFSPTLWNLPTDSKTNLVQCWFPGVHISIGGGSDEPPSFGTERLSDITFAWMMEMCRPFLEFDPIAEWTSHRRNLEMAAEGAPGWALGGLMDSYTWIYKPGFSQTRTPGQYNPNKNNTSDGMYVAQRSREYMHASVRIRDKLRARTKALEGFNLVKDIDAKKPSTEAGMDGWRSGWKWVKTVGNGGIVELPEMRILGGKDSSERDLMSEEVKEMVREGTKEEGAVPSLLD